PQVATRARLLARRSDPDDGLRLADPGARQGACPHQRYALRRPPDLSQSRRRVAHHLEGLPPRAEGRAGEGVVGDEDESSSEASHVVMAGTSPARAEREVLAGALPNRSAETRRVLEVVLERGLALGRQYLEVVEPGIDIAFPHLPRQFVEQLHAVAIGIADVDAVGHAVVDAPMEFDAARLQVLEL